MNVKHLTLSVTAGIAGGSAVLAGAVASVPWLAGFTSGGVAAGSMAAGMVQYFKSLRSLN